jgi:predicted amidohydrolase
LKIGIAQITPLAGNVEHNVNRHIDMIKLAVQKNAKAIFFPELSITGYEPELINNSIDTFNAESKLSTFQKLSDENDLVIGIGAPLKIETGIQIAMYIFQKNRPMTTYAKQTLHEDETPYFVPGTKQVVINIEGYNIAPAICYESVLHDHARKASTLNADIYLASVAKSHNGIKKAISHFPRIAQEYGFTVLLSNSVGKCDDFVSAGNSAAWNSAGQKLAELDNETEGVLLIDVEKNDTCTMLLS